MAAAVVCGLYVSLVANIAAAPRRMVEEAEEARGEHTQDPEGSTPTNTLQANGIENAGAADGPDNVNGDKSRTLDLAERAWGQAAWAERGESEASVGALTALRYVGAQGYWCWAGALVLAVYQPMLGLW